MRTPSGNIEFFEENTLLHDRNGKCDVVKLQEGSNIQKKRKIVER